MKPCSTINRDLSENVVYNNPSFPAYVRRGLLSSYPNYSAMSHWHDDLEFIVILDGSMTYNVNGELIELTKGNGIFVNSRNLHYGFSEVHNQCDFLCVLLHPSLLHTADDFFSRYVERVLYDKNHPYMRLSSDISWQSHCLALIADIYQNIEKEMAPFIIMRHFLEIFEYLFSYLSPDTPIESTSTSDLDSLKSMLRYIQGNYQNKITLVEIANSGSCCKSKCAAFFKKYLKESPITYLTRYRLSQSLNYLNATDKTVTEIAYDCGFGGASYYCEIFNKYYGMTPLEYRRKQQLSSAYK